MDQNLRGVRMAAAAALTACASAGLGVELTEKEAITRALARPAHVDLEVGRLAVARGAVTAAGLLPNPVLTLEEERLTAGPGRLTQRTVVIEQSFDLFGRRSLRVQAAEQRLAAAEHDAHDRRLQTTAEVRRSFADSLSLEREEQALGAWVKRIEAAGGTVGRLAKAGEVAGYAHRRIEREVRAARVRLAMTSAEAARVKERVRGLVGLADAQELHLAGDLATAELPPLGALVARLRARPDLAALQAQAAAYDRERTAAEHAWAPDLTLGLGHKQVDEANRSDTGVIISLAFPLALFDRGQGRSETAAGQARALRAEHDLRASRLEAALRGLWQQAFELRESAAALRAAPMDDLSRTAEAAYRAGEGGILELLDAYRSELEAALATLNLELRARLARIELDESSGADLAN